MNTWHLAKFTASPWCSQCIPDSHQEFINSSELHRMCVCRGPFDTNKAVAEMTAHQVCNTLELNPMNSFADALDDRISLETQRVVERHAKYEENRLGMVRVIYTLDSEGPRLVTKDDCAFRSF